MANSIRKAVIQANINNELKKLYVETGADSVMLDESTTLAAKLTEIISALSGKADTTAMNTAISTAIDNLIDGAPGTYDTLKEIADYISAHEEVVTALNQAIGNKVDKVEGKGLSANDFTTALKEKLENSTPHAHENKSVLDAITADTIASWNGKSNIYIQENQPSNLQNGDIWLQILPDSNT